LTRSHLHRDDINVDIWHLAGPGRCTALDDSPFSIFSAGSPAQRVHLLSHQIGYSYSLPEGSHHLENFTLLGRQGNNNLPVVS